MESGQSPSAAVVRMSREAENGVSYVGHDAAAVPYISPVRAAEVLARFRGNSGDGLLDSLRLRFAMTAVGMNEYEQRVVLGGEFSLARADLKMCAHNISEYSKFEYDRCAEVLQRMDMEDLSYWSRPLTLLQVLYYIVVADHRRKADHPVKRAWDFLHLCFIIFFFCSSTYVNLVELKWDTDVEHGSRGLLYTYYVMTCFFALDVALTTQLATRNDSGKLLLDPSQIMRRKALVLVVDCVAVLPLDFILQAAGQWVPFLVFRGLKYAKVLRPLFLFEVVNSSTVTKGRLRFFYELKPLIQGTYWTAIVLQVSAVLHQIADIHHGDEETGKRHWHDFMESYIIAAAAFIGSPAEILCYNDYERLIVVTLMLVTLVFQGIVIAKFSTLLLSREVADENTAHLRTTLSTIEHYKVPASVQREVLSYQLHDLHDNASLHIAALAVLPDKMLNDVNTYSKISAVRQVPLFADASRECQELLATMLSRAEFPPQQSMVSFGEIGEDMFMITHGYAEVIIATGKTVATLTRGDFFGEMALFSESGKRMATVRALTYVDAWRLTRTQFIKVCAMYPEFLKRIGAEVETRGVDRKAFDKAVEGAMVQYSVQSPDSQATSLPNLVITVAPPTAQPSPSGGSAQVLQGVPRGDPSGASSGTVVARFVAEQEQLLKSFRSPTGMRLMQAASTIGVEAVEANNAAKQSLEVVQQYLRRVHNGTSAT